MTLNFPQQPGRKDQTCKIRLFKLDQAGTISIYGHWQEQDSLERRAEGDKNYTTWVPRTGTSSAPKPI